MSGICRSYRPLRGLGKTDTPGPWKKTEPITQRWMNKNLCEFLGYFEPIKIESVLSVLLTCNKILGTFTEYWLCSSKFSKCVGRCFRRWPHLLAGRACCRVEMETLSNVNMYMLETQMEFFPCVSPNVVTVNSGLKFRDSPASTAHWILICSTVINPCRRAFSQSKFRLCSLTLRHPRVPRRSAGDKIAARAVRQAKPGRSIIH